MARRQQLLSRWLVLLEARLTVSIPQHRPLVCRKRDARCGRCMPHAATPSACCAKRNFMYTAPYVYTACATTFQQLIYKEAFVLIKRIVWRDVASTWMHRTAVPKRMKRAAGKQLMPHLYSPLHFRNGLTMTSGNTACQENAPSVNVHASVAQHSKHSWRSADRVWWKKDNRFERVEQLIKLRQSFFPNYGPTKPARVQ